MSDLVLAERERCLAILSALEERVKSAILPILEGAQDKKEQAVAAERERCALIVQQFAAEVDDAELRDELIDLAFSQIRQGK